MSEQRFSWGLCLAGGAVAAAVTFLLLTLGAGVGLMFVRSAETGVPQGFFTGGAIYFFVAQAFGFAAGGHIAGRLLGPVVESHLQEEIRAAVHGLVTWAATILGTLVVIAIAGHATATLYGLGRSDAPTRPTALLIDRLFRPAPSTTANPAPGQAAQAVATPELPHQTTPTADPAAARAEAGRLIEADFGPRAQLSTDDRARLIELVRQQAGVTTREATLRVAAAESQALHDTAQALETARRRVSTLSLWTAFALLFGAIVAMVAAVTARLEDDAESPWGLFAFHRGWRN